MNSTAKTTNVKLMQCGHTTLPNFPKKGKYYTIWNAIVCHTFFSGKVEIVGYSFIGYCNTQSNIHLGIKTKIS